MWAAVAIGTLFLLHGPGPDVFGSPASLCLALGVLLLDARSRTAVRWSGGATTGRPG
ncbi:hypothetical protein [Streptosporangium carneum]|uniref:Uncharacterized protein n=1 Tax=Streptosporangium carneum TaxID=47481 RepID=A0A9W6I7U0_9ACTN|nr:hypothetical protein [Streptosporangium carneum]GLK12981.1 hypothetical protein GCM10017600_63910 [Streptosporangium carneum]